MFSLQAWSEYWSLIDEWAAGFSCGVFWVCHLVAISGTATWSGEGVLLVPPVDDALTDLLLGWNMSQVNLIFGGLRG